MVLLGAEVLVDAPGELVGIVCADSIQNGVGSANRRWSEIGSIAVAFQKGLDTSGQSSLRECDAHPASSCRV